MTNYTISLGNSVVGPGTAFEDLSTTVGNSLVVEADGSLISTGSSAVRLMSADWKIKIDGLVSGVGTGLELFNSDPTADSSVLINADGEVSGSTGIAAYHHTNIVNNGKITGSGTGVQLYGTSDQDMTIRNGGTITGATGISNLAWGGDLIISNSGAIIANAGGNAIYSLTMWDVKIKNTGNISGGIALSSGNDTLDNSGTITGYIDLGIGSGFDRVSNSGTISGDIQFGSGADVFRNSGTVTGRLMFWDGNDVIVNSGTLEQGLDMGFGIGIRGNKITNSGTIRGDLKGGYASDMVVNTGVITGTVLLGDGDDTFIGGISGETVNGDGGADTIRLGAGDDRYIATATWGDKQDIVNGGAGLDHYDASGAWSSVLINADSVAHDFAGYGKVDAGTAYGQSISGTIDAKIVDKISGFERLSGGSADDAIFGSATGNTIAGGAGRDVLMGLGGNDELRGDSEDDILVGGRGADTLFGGTGADSFRYLSIKDSGIGAAWRDVVEDFEAGIDNIDLTAIDADARTAGDQSFRWLGSGVAFDGNAGALRATTTAAGLIVEADVNGDRRADFSIYLDVSPATVLSAGDFKL